MRPQGESKVQALITKVSSMSGNLAELLAVAQLVADRVSTEGAVLVRAGCFAWLAAALRRTDVLSSAAAAHRLCYATRCVLEACAAAASASTPTGVQATLLVRLPLRSPTPERRVHASAHHGAFPHRYARRSATSRR